MRRPGRPRHPLSREEIGVKFPFELLDLVEDLSHQAYWTRSQFIIEAVRVGSRLLAERLGLEYDRVEKVTYKQRGGEDISSS
ncbi:MAG: hypothetical protein HYZ26_09100 [Chloroflexi bacterium]|nr:hypothetical protein [Chloroflexota bacterium]